ncbi:MAG TPA: ATP synthase F0 subunit A, partial [Bacteroidetes bacterium]|nr:ATP synthase F0 subunit A [Bacteroidota bacterium]
WNVLGYHINLPHFKPIHILGIELDFSITNHVVMIWAASIILILLFRFLYRREQIIPKGIAAVLELFVLFIRDEIAIPNIGEKDGRKFTPLLCTMFFFILTCNLMGLIPLFTTATGDISVTASLAIITFITVQLAGMKRFGVLGYFKNLAPHGIPVFLNVIIVPIEFLGLFTKPFALAMRLFANMIAGHTVIFALLGLIIALGSIFVSPFAVGFAVFINLLELLVAFIQAYIFTMLSAVFIGMALNPEH